jgi:serine/threonine protein kinase
MDAYEDIKPLGRGSYAVVRLVRKLDTSELFVVKRFHVPLTELTAKERTEVRPAHMLLLCNVSGHHFD